MGAIVIDATITRQELAAMAEQQFGNLVKAVVDVERGIMAIGGELHADEEALLLEQGAKQAHLWGVNLYPAKPAEDWIEFDSMVNVRPSQGNFSRGIEDPTIRQQIREVVTNLVSEHARAA